MLGYYYYVCITPYVSASSRDKTDGVFVRASYIKTRENGMTMRISSKGACQNRNAPKGEDERRKLQKGKLRAQPGVHALYRAL